MNKLKWSSPILCRKHGSLPISLLGTFGDINNFTGSFSAPFKLKATFSYLIFFFNFMQMIFCSVLLCKRANWNGNEGTQKYAYINCRYGALHLQKWPWITFLREGQVSRGWRFYSRSWSLLKIQYTNISCSGEYSGIPFREWVSASLLSGLLSAWESTVCSMTISLTAARHFVSLLMLHWD